ncbi:MAG: hypothetical protein CMC43_02430, partial [Flavobacteriaceae bacterium]|nr:hypothetical protein [Flavobacteriaceae bacterium]
NAATEVVRTVNVNDSELSLNNTINSTISIYPNPVSNILYIEKDVSVLVASIYDINGKKLMSWYGQKNQYDLSFLLNGIYFIEIITQNNLFCTRNIIKI